MRSITSYYAENGEIGVPRRSELVELWESHWLGISSRFSVYLPADLWNSFCFVSFAQKMLSKFYMAKLKCISSFH